MTRHTAREHAFLALFSTTFGATVEDAIAAANEEGEYPLDDFAQALLRLCDANAAEIDAAIESRLKGWKVHRLPKSNLAVLRLAVGEMLYGKPDMDSVVINEAVELAKRYGDEGDYQFVNGVLGSLSRGKADGTGAQGADAVPPPEGDATPPGEPPADAGGECAAPAPEV